MSTPATPTSVVTDAVDGLGDDLMGIAAIGLGVGALLFAVKKGWRLVTGFIR